MASGGGNRCEACCGGIGLWQAAFTSECAHIFHLRCVSGSAACPVCAARWSDAPATGPAPAPATPFSFASTGLFGKLPSSAPKPFSSASTPDPALGNAVSSATPTPSSTGLFGQSAAAAANSSSQTGLFGQTSPSTPNPFSFSFSRPASPPSPPSTGRSLFGQQAPATPNPFWLSSAPPPPATQTPSCPVCHGAMGRGQATVTSECNHTFHLRCFSGTVCPVCGARWRDELNPASSPPPNPASSPPRPPLFQRPPAANTSTAFRFSPFPWPSASGTSFGPQPPSSDTARPVFNDDEPVEHPLDARDTAQETASNRVLVLKTHCEHPAVARDSALDSFAVLVHAKGPAAASERAPLDLVTVLDVSGSMCGPKLELLKKAMDFVIDHLGPSDRLSIVIFSSNARRIIRLTRMSDGGKVSAKRAVESLATISTTNIGDGLRVAAEVLDGRRHRNPIASVILLSDGEDNHTLGCFQSGTGRTKSYIDLVPWSLRRSDDNRCAPPVHTFGFGTDHDAAAMHTIAEATGGTFSFIQNQAVLQDSFAQCIGGLLSVAVQEGRVAVECLHPGVRVRVVKSGRYGSRVDADGRAASVDVGELYADEERRFLVFLDVPVAAGDGAAEDGGGVTPLIKVSSTYKDAATGRPVDVSCEDASVRRPVVVADMEPCVEVARELFRVEAAEDIAAARAAAERGEHAKAARILDRRQEASAAAGLAGDERCAELVAELRELSARVADRREYEQTGRACLLAGMSSHAQQRASTVQLFASAAPSASPFGAATGFSPGASIGSLFGGFGQQQGSGSPSFGFWSSPSQTGATSPFSAAAPAPRFGFCFATPAMQSMVESSRKAREQQQSEPGGSPFGPK
ncbi:hypothetical protein PVAP13_5KG534400 [Panicum virgatum]|uniref:Uncharacterized protein n=1 Tax=Panicum virgatum TaxID=38727 RepID=A0A8T0SYK3_PANVG|nr:hypothetical protein PVAP13_5KG534400 [Panicum virgatum]